MPRHRAARLAAVQALYQIEVTGAAPGAVVEEFSRHRLGKSQDGETPAKVDAALFGEIVRGASSRKAELDGIVAAALGPERPTERLEIVMGCILRAGTYELLARRGVPARAAITEYVDLARGFFAGNEPKLVNGVLDRIARTLRPDEFGNERAKEAG